MHISWARLASFCQLGVISDPLIVSKFHNETHDPKGQENKIDTIVKGRETFYQHQTIPVTLYLIYLIKFQVNAVTNIEVIRPKVLSHARVMGIGVGSDLKFAQRFYQPKFK